MHKKHKNKLQGGERKVKYAQKDLNIRCKSDYFERETFNIYPDPGMFACISLILMISAMLCYC